MSFKDFMREMKDGISSMSRRVCTVADGRSDQVRNGSQPLGLGMVQQYHDKEQPQEQWRNLPQELLLDIIQRVEANEVAWPARRQVVSCASVCRSWREATKEVVQTLEECGRITFPISLKQPGPRDFPLQCFVRRSRATSTYRLYLGQSPSLNRENDKFLLAARKFRQATSTEIVISMSYDDFSHAGSSYVGKLRSNFVATKFTLFDSQPPCDDSTLLNCRRSRKNCKQVSPRPAGMCNIASISYELKVLQPRGPRRMNCIMKSIPISSIQEGGTAPTPTGAIPLLQQSSSTSGRGKEIAKDLSSTFLSSESAASNREPLVLKNKVPRWHEQLQCWCLNFRGRVTVASVKNFQLVAAVNPSDKVPEAEQEKVILQFGKIGQDIFTMDYCYPLSAFQAFAICLTSFDTKIACE